MHVTKLTVGQRLIYPADGLNQSSIAQEEAKARGSYKMHEKSPEVIQKKKNGTVIITSSHIPLTSTHKL